MRAKQFLCELNDPVTHDKDGPIVHVTMATLYHCTLTKNVAKIKSKGILPLQTSNWVQAGTGERYGGGYIFAFEHLVDAARWAAKWDWEISHKMGSGQVSVISFTDDVNDWETDDADPLGQASARGKWMKKQGHVPPQNIKSVQPATMDLIKQAVHESVIPSAKSVLFEYSRQITAQNLGDKIIAVAKRDPSVLATAQFVPGADLDMRLDWFMEGLEEIDPTPHKEYVQWLCKIYAGGQVKLEDLESRGKDTLERFNKLKIKKQLIPVHRDINAYKTFQQFEETVSSYPEVEMQGVDKGKSNLILDDEQLRIIQPLNPEAAKYYGQGTKWCTAAKNNNMFERYNKIGNLYVIIPKVSRFLGEKYQFHFEAKQFMDPQDLPIDLEGLLVRFPQLQTLFEKPALQNKVVEFFVSVNGFEVDFEDLMPMFVDAIRRKAGSRSNILKVRNLIISFLKSQDSVTAHKIGDAVYNTILNDYDGLAGVVGNNLKSNMFLAGDEIDNSDIQFLIGDWFSNCGIAWEDISGDIIDPQEIEYEVQDRVWTVIVKPAITQVLGEYLQEMSELL